MQIILYHLRNSLTIRTCILFVGCYFYTQNHERR
nr:MAG TPA: hypothetical protein [Caudoviricetes sp.]